MKTYRVDITGVSDFMFGKKETSEKGGNETHEQFAQRVWKEQIHQKDGHCFIQPFAFKNALESAARWLSMGIPGEGKKTFTKRFTSGVLIVDRMMLLDSEGKPIHIDTVEPLRIFAPADGKRGSAKRVWRIFPVIHDWSTSITIHVLDDKISQDVLEKHCVTAGQFVGMGSMRVENGGINGRFTVDAVKLVADQDAAIVS